MDTPPKVSPTIHEAMIERHFAKDEGSAALLQLRDAVKATRTLANKATTVTEAVLANTLKTMPMRHREARATNFTLLETATKSLDAALAVANAEIAAIKEKLKGPVVKDVNERGLQSEIRSRLAMLPEDVRRKVIGEAVKNGDDTVVGAVLLSRPWMCGVTETDLLMTRNNWNRTRHPEDLSRLERLEAAVADLKRIGPLAISYIDGLTDSKIISEAEAMEKQANDAIAEAKRA